MTVTRGWNWAQRCEFVAPAPDSWRCGLPANHEGHAHHALIPSNAPWFPKGRPKRPIRAMVIAQAQPRSTHSVAPELVQQCRLLKLPPVTVEYQFHPVRLWKFDLAFITRALAIEVDGGGYVAGRHARGRGLEKDAEKFAEAAILGWTVLRVTTRQVRTGQALEWIQRWLRRNSPEG